MKIFFDSNDEYVTREQIPELLQSARSQHTSGDESIDSGEDTQRILD